MNTEPTNPLTDLRNQIDAFDQQIQSLLEQRTAVVEQVGELKKQQGLKVFIKPGREAEVLRKILGRHKGPMQARVVAQLWREIMMASLYVEQPFSVAVVDTVSCRKLARDHFGCIVEQVIVDSAHCALKKVQDGHCMFAVIAEWQAVVKDLGETQVVFKLPVVYREREKPEVAFVLGNVTSEETGDDTVLEYEGKFVGRYANAMVLSYKAEESL